MLRFIVVALVVCVARGAIADVSHLASHYLPPMNGMAAAKGNGGMSVMSGNNGNGHNGDNGGNGHNGGHGGIGGVGVMQSVTTSIEKQELRELPTQTEYLQPGQLPYGISSGNNNGNGGNSNGNNNGNSNDNSNSMEIRPLAMLMPQELLPTPSEPQPLPIDMRTPATHYLPPQTQQQPQQPQQPATPTTMLAPMEYMQPPAPAAQPSITVVMPMPMPMPTTPSRQYVTPQMQPPRQDASMMPEEAPALSAMPLQMPILMPTPMPMPMPMPTPVRHYLPPHLAQPTTYQRYQEEQLLQQEPAPTQPAVPMRLPMPAEFMQKHRQLMQYVFPTIEASVAVMPQAETEAAPAHFLAADGYHYHSGNTVGSANSVASRRFRTRL